MFIVYVKGRAFTHQPCPIHTTSSRRTRPEVIRSSAKSFGSIPCSGMRARSIPLIRRRSIAAQSYMSSLRRVSQAFAFLTGHALGVKLEIELPNACIRSEISVLVAQCYSELNDLEQVGVTPHGLVPKLRQRLEVPYGSGDCSW